MNLASRFVRYFLLASAAALAVLTIHVRGQGFPVSGPAIPGLEPIDAGVTNFMARYRIPGGAFGLVRDGKLIFVRGYGYADTNSLEPVHPDSLFRIASLSKAVTAAGVLQLSECGSLGLDEPAFALLNYNDPTYAGAKRDSRLSSITVRQLLNHSGGWNRSTGVNPAGGTGMDPTVSSFWTTRIAAAMGVERPAKPEVIIRWMMGQPLQFDPGSQYQYSNFGYTVLGRIIEKLSGQSYEAYIQSMLQPAGISRMRIGGSRLAERFPGEVVYYDYPDAPKDDPAFPDETAPVSEAYSRSVPTMDAHGGWVASAIDLLRFIAVVDGRDSPPDILSPFGISDMTARPVPPWAPSDASYYGMGWMVRPDSDNWWHTGALPGTGTEMIRAGNGLTWVILFNFRAYHEDNNYFNDLDRIGWNAQALVKTWPTHDLFPATLSYTAWKTLHFTANEQAGMGVAGDLDDPDGDGLGNLMEYGLGHNPKHADSAWVLEPQIKVAPIDGQNHLYVSFRRLLLEHEVDYRTEVSSDLLSWQSMGMATLAPVLNPDGTETVTYWDPAPVSGSRQRFVRLTVARRGQD
jgi:N-acyl-D-amino-acid deacylase